MRGWLESKCAAARVWCIGTSLACGVGLGSPARAEPPAAPTASEGAAELSARLTLLKSRDPQVRGPADQAALALARAQDSKQDSATRTRSLEIARAALTLAEARLVLLAERQLKQRAEARQKSAAQRAHTDAGAARDATGDATQ